MRDILNFSFQAGYYSTGNVVNVPEGSIIPPSANVVYDPLGKLTSFRGMLNMTNYSGGTRAFVIDNSRIAFLGSVSGGTKQVAIGNLLQGVGKSIWFVGNTLTDGVKVVDVTSSPTTIGIGGTTQQETLTFAGTPTPSRQSTATNGTYDVISLSHSYVVGQPLKMEARSMVATFNDTTDVFTGNDSGLGDDMPVTLNGTLPANFDSTTTYYIRDRASSGPTNVTFKLATSVGGTAVDGGAGGTDITVYPTLDPALSTSGTYYTMSYGGGYTSLAVGASSQLCTFNGDTDFIAASGHGLINGDIVEFTGGTLPTGLSTLTWYYVVNKTASTFQVSTSSGGSAVNFTGNGSGNIYVIGKLIGFSTDRLVRVVPCFVPVTITSSVMTDSPLKLWTELSTTSETLTTLVEKVRDKLRTSTTFAANFYASASGAVLTVTDKQIRANNFDITIGTNQYGVNTASSSTVVTGAIDYSGNLSTTPQFAKWDYTNSRWNSPVQIGVPEIEETPILTLTTTSTRSSGFSGLVSGSRSIRVARKRYGAVSIGSPSSNVVEAAETGDTLVVTIPLLDADASLKSDNTWLLYATYRGLGSTATHKLFPIEIPESELDGSEAMTLHELGNAKYKVISQSATSMNDRKVEIEFNDNELLLLEPYDDYYPMEPCKFLTKLGNVLCGIGAGDDSTGFDVSYPNNFEAFSPDWRDWFAEVPVGVATEQDMGAFWVCTANQTYIATWTGVTEGSAPVVIEKRSPLFGAIGAGAMACIGGTLFTLSKGKTPVKITPDGQIDIQFGIPVFGALSSFDDTTQIAYDEDSASVIYACGTTALAYSLMTNLWSAPLTLGSESPVVNNCLAMFPLNGNMYVCQFTASNFVTKKYNENSDLTNNAMNWTLVGAFQYGQTGRFLKDIIQVEAVISSEVAAGDVEFLAYKNFDLSTAAVTLNTVTISSTAPQITIRKYAESNDYDVVAPKITGTRGGQTVHMAMYTVDVHKIERVT